ALLHISPFPFFSFLPRPPRSPLFPYTTLFRSCLVATHRALRTLCFADVSRQYTPVAHLAGAAVYTISVALAIPALHVAHIVDRRSEEHTSELQSLAYLVCRLLLEKKTQALRLH